MVLRYSNQKFLTVLEPVGQEQIGWEARAVSPTDWATVLAYVPRFVSMELQRASNDFGMGKITLDSDDPILHDALPAGMAGTILDRECLWQFFKDGVLRHEWLGEDSTEDVISDGEARVTEVSGRTTESVLGWGVAIPGLVTKWVPDPKVKKPKGWGTNLTVEWAELKDDVATLTLGTHSMKVGVPVYVYDVGSVFNGSHVITAVTKTKVSYAKTNANMARHEVTGRVQANPSVEDPEKAAKFVAPLVSKQVRDPMEFSEQPAVNALQWLVKQNIQPRNCMPFVTLMFSGVLDSYGQPWADVSDVVVSEGETPLALLQRLAGSLGWEFKMLPGFRLFIAQDGFGQHREGEVQHFVGGSQREHSRSGTTREVATRIFAKAQDGTMSQAIGVSNATPWTRETFLEAGDAASSSGASRVANSSLSLLKDRKVGRTVQVLDEQPTRTLFDDYDVNDWITVEDEKSRPFVVKIVAATVSVDSDAAVTLELTIQTKFEYRAVKVQRTLDKMGASASSSISAKPISSASRLASMTLSEMADVNTIGVAENDLLQWDGSQWAVRSPDQLVADIAVSLADLIDVDTTAVPATDGQALVWDEDAGLWMPGDVESGGGGGGGGGSSFWAYGLSEDQEVVGQGATDTSSGGYSAFTATLSPAGAPVILHQMSVPVYTTTTPYELKIDGVVVGIVSPVGGRVTWDLPDILLTGTITLSYGPTSGSVRTPYNTAGGPRTVGTLIYGDWVEASANTMPAEFLTTPYVLGEFSGNGMSAYQVAVEGGFVGTEAEWLASLVGPEGDEGPAGPPNHLSDLLDVDVATAPPAAGQVLVWDAVEGIWEPGDVEGGGGGGGTTSLLGHGSYNKTGSQASIPSTNPWTVSSADQMAFTLSSPTLVEINGGIAYMMVSGTVDFRWQISSDGGIVWTTLDPYEGNPSWVLEASKSRMAGSNWFTQTGPIAILDLPPGSYLVRLQKASTGSGNFAEHGGLFYVKSIG